MTQTITFGPLRVEFVPRGDRIAHTIYAAEDGGDGDPGAVWRPLLHSVEGTADAGWPESPPLQELHVEQRDGRSVAMLVGRAGKSHWSASIGLEVGPDGDETLAFDVACRVAVKPFALRSTYQLAESVATVKQPTPESGDSLRARSIVLAAADGSTWEFAVDGPGYLAAASSPETVSIEPPADADTVPATVRWRYTIRRTKP